MDEIFKSDKLEKLKREIGELLEEEVLVQALSHRKKMESLVSEEKKEEPRTFWEEELIHSMGHKALGDETALRVELTPYLAEEVSG